MNPELGTPPRVLYAPDSQDSARYAVRPWDRIEVVVGNNPLAAAPNRSGGVVLDQIEGEGLIVERADYPALLAPVVGQAPIAEGAVAARDGLQFDVPFKGLWLQHPQLLTNVAGQLFVLSLVVYKRRGVLQNQLATAITRIPLSTRLVTNTGTVETLRIFVPQGVRALVVLDVFVTHTTLTSATVNFFDAAGQVILAPTVQQQIAAAVVTYGSANTQLNGYVNQGGGVAGSPALIRFDVPIPIPSACREVEVQLGGTGMTQPQAWGVWV